MRGIGVAGRGRAIAGEVLHADLAEDVAADLQLGVEPLQHAQAELALALDRDDPGVRQLVRGVGLELDALLEVDQVELDLVRAVDQRATLVISACSSVDLPEPVLPAIRTCCDVPLPSFRCWSFVAPERPSGTSMLDPLSPVQYSSGRGDDLERHLDAVRVARRLADLVEQAWSSRRRAAARRASSGNGLEDRVAPDELAVSPGHADGSASQVVLGDARRQRLARCRAEDQRRRRTARRSGRCGQPLGGRLAEVGREVGDDQDAERLGHLAGLGVVFLDRLELVAQVLLDDVLHVLGQVGEPLLDLLRLGPDPAGDQHLVVVGQVHEGGEVLAQADGVDDREPHLARRAAR